MFRIWAYDNNYEDSTFVLAFASTKEQAEQSAFVYAEVVEGQTVDPTDFVTHMASVVVMTEVGDSMMRVELDTRKKVIEMHRSLRRMEKECVHTGVFLKGGKP